jgi:hypothetical protein
MTKWRMRIACWIPKATNTHSEYTILIACPVQQLLHERTSILGYTHVACIVLTTMDFMRAVIEVDNINVHSGDRICRSADVHLNILFQIHNLGTLTEFGVCLMSHDSD